MRLVTALAAVTALLAAGATRPCRTARLWTSRASATVRGTWWLTADFCKYTLVRVNEGSVTVQNLVSKKFQVIRAPKSFTARPGRP
jgi:hypothetical protein